MDPLVAEGVTGMQLLVITGWDQATGGPNWEDRAPEYDEVSVPVLPDRSGVYYLYAADYYDAVLIDKKGRLVQKQRQFSSQEVERFKQRIRELDAE